MMNDIIERYQFGKLKHKIEYYPNGCKYYEQYFDQNGKFHREPWLPDFQQWWYNGYLCLQTFCIHGLRYNISNPAVIWYNGKGKINNKYYYIKGYPQSNKLNWNNNIKQIEI